MTELYLSAQNILTAKSKFRFIQLITFDLIAVHDKQWQISCFDSQTTHVVIPLNNEWTKMETINCQRFFLDVIHHESIHRKYV